MPQTARFIAEDPIGAVGGSFNLYLYARLNPVQFTDPTGLKTWIYTQTSLGVSAGPFAGERGHYNLIDPFSGEMHTWDYWGYGVGFGAGVAFQAQVGMYEGPDDPTHISDWGLEINGFAAAGYKGMSGSYGGTGFAGNGESWGSGGWAAGAGGGISAMGTKSTYRGKSNVLPDSVREMIDKLRRQLAGKK